MGFLDRFRAAPAVVKAPETIDVYKGAVAPGVAMPPQQPAASVLQAAGEYPWVYACVRAVVGDLCGLPFYFERTVNGQTEPIEHPALNALMEHPSPGKSGDHLRRQFTADVLTVGNGFLALDRPSRPTLLYRVHPQYCRAEPTVSGAVGGWEVGYTARQHLPADRVIHARLMSFGDGIDAEVYGASPLAAVSGYLTAEGAITARLARDAKLARPDMVMSPPEGTQYNADQVSRLAGWVREWAQSKGGVLIMPFASKIDQVGASSRDQEYEAKLERITATVLGVFRVPPSRVGIQSANYATAQQEAVLHWEARRDDATVLEAAWTDLARRWPGFETVRFRYDFSGVDALSAGRDAQLRRVGMHILNGIPAAAAYEAEGMSWEAGQVEAIAAPATDADNAARHVRAALETLTASVTAGTVTPDLATEAADALRVALARMKP